jgi:hypothetical protein
MEYVKDTKPKEIQISHLDTKMVRKDVVFARYSYNGMEIPTVLVVITS